MKNLKDIKLRSEMIRSVSQQENWYGKGMVKRHYQKQVNQLRNWGKKLQKEI